MLGGAANLIKRIPCGPLTKWLGKACFTAGTLVHTKEGLKPIEQIKAGDEVLSFNEQTKRTEYKAVLETYIRETETIVRLRIEGETKQIETTPEHPFYKRVHRARDGLSSNDDDDEGEWRASGELQVGDVVRQANGKWVKVENIIIQAGKETVYNFAVADNHNYFVSEQGILVHNTYNLTDDAIKKALEGAELLPSQNAVSKPVIENSLGRLKAGEIPPDILVDGNVIVNGHHRYIAGRIFGKEPGIQPWQASKPGINWNDVFIDPTDWGMR